MGALQSGLPIPSAIPTNTFKIILNLKHCFYTIPLAPKNYKNLILMSHPQILNSLSKNING